MGLINTLLSGNVLDGVKGIINSIHLDPNVKAQVNAELDKSNLLREQLESERVLALAEINERNIESARARQIAVKDKTIAILSLFIPGMFFLMLGLIVFHAIPIDNKEVFYTAFGTIGATLLAVVNYHYGSSSGSDRKTEIIAKNLSDASKV